MVEYDYYNILHELYNANHPNDKSIFHTAVSATVWKNISFGGTDTCHSTAFNISIRINVCRKVIRYKGVI